MAIIKPVVNIITLLHKGPPTLPINKGVEQMFMEALFTRMLKSTSSTTKLTEQEKLRQQQEELEKKKELRNYVPQDLKDIMILFSSLNMRK
ncbi:MAG: hypothetical protein Q7U54_13825 [Bacteroidales bacterium]|nr:hypothetical protein [Bacteroidales bacterium]